MHTQLRPERYPREEPLELPEPGTDEALVLFLLAELDAIRRVDTDLPGPRFAAAIRRLRVLNWPIEERRGWRIAGASMRGTCANDAHTFLTCCAEAKQFLDAVEATINPQHKDVS